MLTLLVSAVSMLPAQDAPSALRVLKLGDVVEGEVTADTPLVHTPTLDEKYADAPIRGASFNADLPADVVTIELSSNDFDAYLVVRDELGHVVAEDDDGWFATHSRVVLDGIRHAATLRVEACALHGEIGAYRVKASLGKPPVMTARERDALELDAAREGLRSVEAAKGAADPRTLLRLNRVGVLLWKRQEYKEALPIFERALAISEAQFGPDDPRTITCVGNIAVQLMELGDYKAAQPLFDRQLRNLQETLGPDDDTTLWVARNLAFVLSEQGDFARAKELHESVLASSERVSGHDSAYSAQSLNNLANLELKQGNSRAAVDLYRRALRIFESKLGPDHQITMTCMNNLVVALGDLGENEEARVLCERAFAVREKRLGPDHADTAASAMTLGSLLRHAGNAEEARPLLERAMKSLERSGRENHPNTGRCAHELAGALADLGDFKGALALSSRSLEIFESSLGPDQPDTANALGSVAWLLVAQGKHEEALPLLQRELKIRERLVGTEHPAVGMTLNRLALLLQIQGKCEDAESLFERAIAIDRRAPGGADRSLREALGNTALNLCDLRRAKEAAPLAMESWDMLRHDTGGKLLVAADWERFGWIKDNTWIVEALLSVLQEQEDAGATAARAYEAVRFWKGASSRAAISTRARLVSTLDPETRRALEELRGVQSLLSEVTLRYDVRKKDVLDVRLAALRKREGELQRVVAEVGRDGGLDLGTSWKTLEGALPDGAVLVDFFVHRIYGFARRSADGSATLGSWSEPRLSAWIVQRGGGGPIHVDLGPALVVEQATREFLETFARNRGATALGAPSKDLPPPNAANDRLRDLLWRPLATSLGGATRIFVSPDRFLGSLPFGTLKLDDGRFLLEKTAVSNLSDAGALARTVSTSSTQPTRDRADGELLIMGNVAFDRPAPSSTTSVTQVQRSFAQTEVARSFHGRWESLPGTKQEMSSILDAWNAASRDREGGFLALEGAAATEAAVKSALPGKRFVHLATHGFFEPTGLQSWWEELERPDRVELRMPEELSRVTGLMPGLLSGLVCAGANASPTDEQEDAYLMAEEITWLDLSKCDLVVLSACDTGIGTERRGEGMASVQHAFELAGAKAVIASLWKVNDETAAELMKGFYENLWLRHEGVGDALRHAQLEMLRKERIEHDGDERAYKWGAFILTGDWR